VVESQPSKLLVAGSIPVSRSRFFLRRVRMMVSFQPTVIRVEKEKEFEELRGAVDRALGPEKVGKFLKRVRRSGARIRDLEVILARGVFEKIDDTLGKQGAQKLYQALTVSDQAQMREFYLSKVEDVDSALRTKFQQLYRYY
jgi:hypothetical protein